MYKVVRSTVGRVKLGNCFTNNHHSRIKTAERVGEILNNGVVPATDKLKILERIA